MILKELYVSFKIEMIFYYISYCSPVLSATREKRSDIFHIFIGEKRNWEVRVLSCYWVGAWQWYCRPADQCKDCPGGVLPLAESQWAPSSPEEALPLPRVPPPSFSRAPLLLRGDGDGGGGGGGGEGEEGEGREGQEESGGGERCGCLDVSQMEGDEGDLDCHNSV